jgi:hypothetical protein
LTYYFGTVRSNSKAASKAASLLGKRSWHARLEKYGIKKLKKKLGEAGKKATRSGRPRMPDNQVTQNALYQRARRERLRNEKKARKEN